MAAEGSKCADDEVIETDASFVTILGLADASRDWW
jgi:hypothetical protein